MGAKAYSYRRFSRPEQERGDSFRRQSEKVKDFVTRNGLEWVDNYEDRGISAYRGRNKESGVGGLKDFLAAVADGIIEKGSYLLVENLDRISRENFRVARNTIEEIIDNGITLVTLTDGRIYTKESLDANILDCMYILLECERAHKESKYKGERVAAAWGNKRKHAKDKPLTARVPEWLRLNRDTNKIEIIPDRAKIVRSIYRLYLSGTGAKSIAKTLNSEGVEPWGRGRQKGKWWHPSYVDKILVNPAVVGTYIACTLQDDGKTKSRVKQDEIGDYFPKVIEPEVFTMVQERKRIGTMPARTEVRNIFARLAKCPLCGATLTRTDKSGKKGIYVYLVCTKAKAGAGCKCKNIPYFPLVERFLPRFKAALIETPTDNEKYDALRGEIAFTQSQIEEYEMRLSRLLEAIKAGNVGYDTDTGLIENEQVRAVFEKTGLIFPKTIMDEMLNIEVIIEDNKKYLDKLRAEYEGLKPSVVEMNIKALQEAIESEDVKLINSCLRALCDKIVIDYEAGLCGVRFRHTDVVFNVKLKDPLEYLT